MHAFSLSPSIYQQHTKTPSLSLSFFLSFSLSLSTFEKWKSINVEFSSEEIQAQQHPEYFSSENTFHSFLSPWYIANILKTF